MQPVVHHKLGVLVDAAATFDSNGFKLLIVQQQQQEGPMHMAQQCKGT